MEKRVTLKRISDGKVIEMTTADYALLSDSEKNLYIVEGIKTIGEIQAVEKKSPAQPQSPKVDAPIVKEPKAPAIIENHAPDAKPEMANIDIPEANEMPAPALNTPKQNTIVAKPKGKPGRKKSTK